MHGFIKNREFFEILRNFLSNQQEKTTIRGKWHNWHFHNPPIITLPMFSLLRFFTKDNQKQRSPSAGYKILNYIGYP